MKVGALMLWHLIKVKLNVKWISLKQRFSPRTDEEVFYDYLMDDNIPLFITDNRFMIQCEDRSYKVH